MRVYVAGASKEMPRVRAAMDCVRLAGGSITVDWVAEIERVGAANEGLTQEQRVSSARDDLRGVDECDLFWLLAPDGASTGAWVELGYALALERRIVISGPGSARSIFAALGDYEMPTDAAAGPIVADIIRRSTIVGYALEDSTVDPVTGEHLVRVAIGGRAP